MMTSRPLLEAQVADLVASVDADAAARERATLLEAGEQARELRREAFQQARQQVRAAVATERERVEQELTRAHAALQTRQRQARQSRWMAQLREAWASLEESLLELWTDAEQRRIWLRMVADAANRQLPAGQWTVSCPVDLSEAERASFGALLETGAGSTPGFQLDGEIQAGVRVQAGRATLDGSVAGLLAGRVDIEAALLDEFLRARDAGSGDE